MNVRVSVIISVFNVYMSLYRLGAWQFLADMPFGSVSTETLWKLFWALHADVTKLDSVESIQREDSIRDNWREVLQSMYNPTLNSFRVAKATLKQQLHSARTYLSFCSMKWPWSK